jgi:DNA-binding response OmpR family regulator
LNQIESDERFGALLATKRLVHRLALKMSHSIGQSQALARSGDDLSLPVRPRLLVIEDEAEIAALLSLHLSELPAEVRLAADGRLGLEMALSTDWDLVVLDLHLPQVGGLEICRAIRANGHHVPILILTARASESDRVRGLTLGADDYVSKPFSIPELLARIKAMLRRDNVYRPARSLAKENQTVVMEFGPLRLDRSRHAATLSGRELALAPREWDLLCFFAEHPGKAFSRAELLDCVWGGEHDGYDHTVNSHINRLRAKLGDCRSASSYIHTVWGMGYRFEPANGK